MNVVIDTCSLINLINGPCINEVFNLPGYRFFIGSDLLDSEILDTNQQQIIKSLITAGSLVVLPSITLTSAILVLKAKFDLGLGETECIALCKNNHFTICTDDRKARKSAKTELGDSKVIGSMYLLRQCVVHAILKCLEALNIFKMMRARGGFLPQKGKEYFCT